MDNILIYEDSIELKNNVKIDFWAIWKWYIVDSVYNILIKKIDNFTIDFWWDIKVWKQNQLVWLEDPYDDKKIIWEIYISNISLCSSSGNKRKFNDNNHLINPFVWKSQNDKIAVFVTHKIATLADWFSTALFVSPIDSALKILESVYGLEWLIIWKNWEIYKSSWFNCKLY